MAEASLSTDRERSVEALLRDEQHRPLIVTREVAAAASRLIGRLLGHDPPGWAPPMVVAAAPLLVDRILWLVGAGSSWRAFAWMAAGALLSIALLGSSTWAWMRVQRLGGPIDRMLWPDAREGYLGFVASRLRLGSSHYVVCLGGALT
ncbi:MAG TPA: hypothetical protein VIX82_19310, partial [Solirubrobacteraceae bacterium]